MLILNATVIVVIFVVALQYHMLVWAFRASAICLASSRHVLGDLLIDLLAAWLLVLFLVVYLLHLSGLVRPTSSPGFPLLLILIRVTKHIFAMPNLKSLGRGSQPIVTCSMFDPKKQACVDYSQVSLKATVPPELGGIGAGLRRLGWNTCPQQGHSTCSAIAQ